MILGAPALGPPKPSSKRSHGDDGAGSGSDGGGAAANESDRDSDDDGIEVEHRESAVALDVSANLRQRYLLLSRRLSRQSHPFLMVLRNVLRGSRKGLISEAWTRCTSDGMTMYLGRDDDAPRTLDRTRAQIRNMAMDRSSEPDDEGVE